MTTCNEKKKYDILPSKNFLDKCLFFVIRNTIKEEKVRFQYPTELQFTNSALQQVHKAFNISLKKDCLYYITGSEIREGSESILLFQRVLFNNALPEATAVQDGTRANCQKCSLKPPWSFTINSLQPSSGERLSVGHCIHLPACKTGKAAPGKGEEEKVSQRTSSPCFVILAYSLNSYSHCWKKKKAGRSFLGNQHSLLTSYNNQA